MKFSWILVGALALCATASVKAAPAETSSELFAILDEFLALVPDDKLGEIFITYLYSDKEFQALLEYFKTDAFKTLVQILNSIDDVLNIYDYVEGAGLDVYALLNNLHDTVGLPHLKSRRSSRSTYITGGVAGFISDFQAILPIIEIRALHQEKLKTSSAFARFVDHLESPHFQELVDAVLANKEFQDILKTANEVGIDVIGIVQFYSALLGIEFKGPESTELHDVLREFDDLASGPEYRQLLEAYLLNDKEFNDATGYFASNEFKDIVKKIEDIDDLINFFDYLEEAGLEAYTIVNELHMALHIPPLKPGRRTRSVEITGGTAGFIADYKSILPIDKIHALHQERLETSPAFARFVEYWHSPRFQQLIDALRANEEFQRLLKLAKKGGIDLEAIADLYATKFGLEFPSRRLVKRSLDLYDDLSKFPALIPREKVGQLLEAYLLNDAEFNDATGYFASDEFKDVVQKIERLDDLINFFDYLEEAGLEAYTIVNELHMALNLPPLKPGRRTRSVEITGGTAGFIADYKSILPTDKIHALHQQLLETSPAFARFVEYWNSPRFQQLIDALCANEEFHRLLTIAKQGGIDIKAIVDLYAASMGLEIPTSSKHP